MCGHVWRMCAPAGPGCVAGGRYGRNGGQQECDTKAGRQGRVESKRPYRQQDWSDIQSHVTLAVDNATTAVDEVPCALPVCRPGLFRLPGLGPLCKAQSTRRSARREGRVRVAVM